MASEARGPGPRSVAWLALCSLSLLACDSDASEAPAREWRCQIDGDGAPAYLKELGCDGDFTAMASVPLDSSIPGARSVKTVIDRIDDNALYFQNSQQFAIHWEFVSDQLSGGGLPVVPMLSSFNTTEYYSPDRRFMLGSVTYYEGVDKYCYEIAPYDTADAEMIQQAFEQIAAHSYLGEDLYFHPTSLALEATARVLPDAIPILTTDALYEGIDYQPLNLAESYGRLRFIAGRDLDTEYPSFRDIVVLDAVPNDISVTMGIITDEFQTPLAHINVLSQNRGTPNMALRGAFDREDLRALDGKWVRFEVNAFDYVIEEVDQAVADAWWEENKPSEVQVPGMDLSVTDLRDIAGTVDLESGTLLEAIKAGTRAFGGKAANFGAMSNIEDLPVPKAFAIPVYFYMEFMEQNGFDQQVDAMLADPEFLDSPQARDTRLAALRADMQVATVGAGFESLLLDKLNTEYPGVRVRFRSSTNAEDLDGFTGAGLYDSRSGQPDNPEYPLFDAVREVWASVWSFRAFEERSYRSIDHRQVGMALLVHRSFPDEEANGVALTNNPFDPSGLQPAFYINVQEGEESVVSPDPGTSTDAILYYYDSPGQPITYVSRSSLVPTGASVLTNSQINDLGKALDSLRSFFAPAYAPDAGAESPWWAMDVEFKFDQPTFGDSSSEPTLIVKQARPYGAR